MREKLYGDRAALRKTASFVRATGADVQIKRSRKKKWLRMREKLYGDRAALRKTASFVRATGVDVQGKRWRKKKKNWLR